MEGQFAYNFMSFGLVNAPSTFQRTMDCVLAGLKWNCCQVYLEDIIIYSSTFEKHLLDIVAVLARLQESGLKLKASKCHFACPEVVWLGHPISKEGVRANPEKIELITNWEIPKTAANLHSFVGLAGYYRKLVRNFAQKEAPLTKALMLPPSEFKMGPIEIDTFNELKEVLSSDPILALPNFSGKSRFELHTDASDLGISGVLGPRQPGTRVTLWIKNAHESRIEISYSRERNSCNSVVIIKIQIIPVRISFIVRTDHLSLQYLKNAQKGRLARWAMCLDEFDFEIKYRKGKANINADVASRWTKTPADENWSLFPYYADPVDNHKLLSTTNNALTVMNITKVSAVENVDLRYWIAADQAKGYMLNPRNS
jgi:hypothetical protein